MTDLTKLREALDKMIAGYSYDAFERNGNNYPPARAAVEALFAELTRERDEAEAALSRSIMAVKDLERTLAQARRAVPEGWKLVPETPTQKMHAAAMDALNNSAPWSISGLYAAMLTAVPQPPAQENDK